MTTQLAFDITPKAPLKSMPVILNECPVRDRCLVPVNVGTKKNPRIEPRPLSSTDMLCGFEQAGSVNACPKRKRLED